MILGIQKYQPESGLVLIRCFLAVSNTPEAVADATELNENSNRINCL